MGDISTGRSGVDFFFWGFKNYCDYYYSSNLVCCVFFSLQPLNVSCFVTSSVCVFREHLNKRLHARYW